MPGPSLPEVALMGRSNVGKSSLLNLLVGRRKLAYTSRTPGRTQQINFFSIDKRFFLVDLPGYGYAKVSKQARAAWTRLIERYLREREPLAGVVLLVDSRHGPTDLDMAAIRLLASVRPRVVIALTKVDKVRQRELHASTVAAERALEANDLAATVVPTSAAARRGRRELWRAIEELLADPKPGPGHDFGAAPR